MVIQYNSEIEKMNNAQPYESSLIIQTSLYIESTKSISVNAQNLRWSYGSSTRKYISWSFGHFPLDYRFIVQRDMLIKVIYR